MNIYKQRRKAALKQMPSHSILILFSATAKSVSNDTEYPFRQVRQDSDFYYLSGFNEDNAAIVLIKSGNKQRVVMFVQPKDKMMELWTGKRAGIKKVKNDLSINFKKSAKIKKPYILICLIRINSSIFIQLSVRLKITEV